MPNLDELTKKYKALAPKAPAPAQTPAAAPVAAPKVSAPKASAPTKPVKPKMTEAQKIVKKYVGFMGIEDPTKASYSFKEDLSPKIDNVDEKGNISYAYEGKKSYPYKDIIENPELAERLLKDYPTIKDFVERRDKVMPDEEKMKYLNDKEFITEGKSGLKERFSGYEGEDASDNFVEDNLSNETLKDAIINVMMDSEEDSPLYNIIWGVKDKEGKRPEYGVDISDENILKVAYAFRNDEDFINKLHEQYNRLTSRIALERKKGIKN